MTDQQPPATEEHPVYSAPGCGIATYGCVLIGFGILGIVGLVVSTMGLLQSSFTRPPYSLVPGNQVEVWRLQPMRDAGLLALIEVPLFYHDESSDGTVACALTESNILRIDQDQAWKVPYNAVQGLNVFSQNSKRIAVMTLHNGEDIPCIFLSGEGVERFARFVRETSGLKQ